MVQGTTERASTTEGGCSEDEIIDLLRSGIAQLTAHGEGSSAPSEPEPPPTGAQQPPTLAETEHEKSGPGLRPGGLEIALDFGYTTNLGGFTDGAGPSISLSSGYRFALFPEVFVRPDVTLRLIHLSTAPNATEYGALLGAFVVIPLGILELDGGAHVGPLFSTSGFFSQLCGHISLVLSPHFALSGGLAYEHYFSPPLGDTRLSNFLLLSLGISIVL